MLDPPHPHLPPPRPQARTPTLDEELWAAGVYFRRPTSPPRPSSLVRENQREIMKERDLRQNLDRDNGRERENACVYTDFPPSTHHQMRDNRKEIVNQPFYNGATYCQPTIPECDLEESVLRELESSLEGLSDSSSSTPSELSVRESNTQQEQMNLIEEVVVRQPSPPPPPPPSSVTLKAYYQYPSLPPPPIPPQDSDSGHESGATSPCGTLTGEEPTHTTPPSSPPTAHQDNGVGVAVVGVAGRLALREEFGA